MSAKAGRALLRPSLLLQKKLRRRIADLMARTLKRFSEKIVIDKEVKARWRCNQTPSHS